MTPPSEFFRKFIRFGVVWHPLWTSAKNPTKAKMWKLLFLFQPGRQEPGTQQVNLLNQFIMMTQLIPNIFKKIVTRLIYLVNWMEEVSGESGRWISSAANSWWGNRVRRQHQWWNKIIRLTKANLEDFLKIIQFWMGMASLTPWPSPSPTPWLTKIMMSDQFCTLVIFSM